MVGPIMENESEQINIGFNGLRLHEVVNLKRYPGLEAVGKIVFELLFQISQVLYNDPEIGVFRGKLDSKMPTGAADL